MEQKEEKKVLPKKVDDGANLRVSRETRKMMLAELAKANKKSFGRHVRMDQLVRALLAQSNVELIKRLQDESLSNQDRLDMQYKEHVKKFGSITKDEFIGLILKTKKDTSASGKSEISESKTVT